MDQKMNNTKPTVTWALMVLLLLGGIAISTPAQKINSFNSTTKGQGTVTVSAIDKRKIYAVSVDLKTNGQAEITLFTDMQLIGQATWPVGKDVSQGINLKITGGVVDGNATGTGKLFLSQDGKSIAKLNIQAKTADGSKITVQFLGNPDKNAPAQ